MKRRTGQDREITQHWKPATLAVRGGTARSEWGETSEALFLTSGYAYDCAGDAAARFAGEQQGMTYSRLQNPTVEMLEHRIALLEGAEACRATASGMAAMTAALLCQLSAGDHLVGGRAAFGSCRWLTDTLMPRFGIETTVVDARDPQYQEKATALFVESILLSEFGEGLVNDAGFRLTIRDVARTMSADPATAGDLAALFAELRAGP